MSSVKPSAGSVASNSRKLIATPGRLERVRKALGAAARSDLSDLGRALYVAFACATGAAPSKGEVQVLLHAQRFRKVRASPPG